MNRDQTASGAADSGRSSASGNSISHRDSLALAAAGLTAPLLPTFSLAQTRKESSPMSIIKLGQENSTPIEIYYEDHVTRTENFRSERRSSVGPSVRAAEA
jgi:hypothetical protein